MTEETQLPFSTESAWEFACDWYTVKQTQACLRERQLGGGASEDVHSEEFAEWLTHQVRLAMAQGIMIADQRREDIDNASDT